jgi:hypothetical protein
MATNESRQAELSRALDILFIGSSIIFFIFVGGIWLASKLGNLILLQLFGVIVTLLAVPFAVVFLGYVKERREKVVIISLVLILSYFFLELLLEYMLRIPFRGILALHIVYIIFFYAAAFNMIGVAFRINRRMGFVVSITFWISLACLIYLYVG